MKWVETRRNFELKERKVSMHQVASFSHLRIIG